MKNINYVLIFTSIFLGIISSILFIQLLITNEINTELKDENWDLSGLLKANQLEKDILENQISELQNQTNQLEQRINEIENQRNELEKQLENATNRVKITGFVINGTTFPIVGVGWRSTFFVTVENFGINEAHDLRIVFNQQYYVLNSTTLKREELCNHTIYITTIKVGESKTVQKEIHHGYSPKTFVANLMIDEQILDREIFHWS